MLKTNLGKLLLVLFFGIVGVSIIGCGSIIENSDNPYPVTKSNYGSYKECLPYALSDSDINSMKYNEYSSTLSSKYHFGFSQMDFDQSGDYQTHYQLMTNNRIAVLEFKFNGSSTNRRFLLKKITVRPIEFYGVQ